MSNLNSVEDCPDEIRAAGFRNRAEFERALNRNLTSPTPKRPLVPFSHAEAEAFASDAKRLLAHVEVTPPEPVRHRVKGSQVKNLGRTCKVSPEKFAEFLAAGEKHGNRALARHGVRNITKALARGSCGSVLYGRVMAAAKALDADVTPH